MRELRLNNITWLSLISPTDEDLREIKSRFPEINQLALQDITSPTIRPSHVENFGSHLYVVLHFPNFFEKDKKTVSQEIDFILWRDTLITVQYEDIRLVNEIFNECEIYPARRELYGKSIAHLLNYIIRRFFSFSLNELDELQERIDALEEKVFSGHEKEILEDTALLKRNLLDFRRATKAQHITLESLAIEGESLYGEKTKPILTGLVREYLKVWGLLENHKETLDALYDTNRQLLAAKTNEIMRVFTILAFITFIPTSIANIYGMNISHLPFSNSPYAFWQVLGVMTILTLVVYIVLRWRKLV